MSVLLNQPFYYMIYYFEILFFCLNHSIKWDCLCINYYQDFPSGNCLFFISFMKIFIVSLKDYLSSYVNNNFPSMYINFFFSSSRFLICFILLSTVIKCIVNIDGCFTKHLLMKISIWFVRESLPLSLLSCSGGIKFFSCFRNWELNY